jgi:hypothetical protein
MRAAEISDGSVVRVIVGDPEWAADRLGGVWVGTESKVGIGWTYDETDGFRPPQPFGSWTWTDDAWTAPKPYPEGDGFYSWDEDAEAWVERELIDGG